MAHDRRIEQLITEAMKRGKFDSLSGEGKPMDLDSYSKSLEGPRSVEQLITEAMKERKFDTDTVDHRR